MPDLSARLRAAAATRAEAALALLRGMVAAQRAGEQAVQAEVARGLAAAGAEVRSLRYRPAEVPMREEFAAEPPPGERESVLGLLPGAGGGRSLILFAHPDSEPVPAAHGWALDPFAGVVRDGRLHGWGISDDLSGVAAMVSALDVLRTAGLVPAGDVIVASTPSKRHARGVHAVMHHGYLADAAVYLHPAESGAGMREVKGFACGQIEFRIAVAGRGPDTTEPGHGAFAHRGVNAIEKAMQVMAALRALDARRGARVRHPALEAAIGRSTNLLVGGIEGGTARGTRVPTECVLSCALAFPPGETLSAVRAEIEAAVAEAAASDPWLRGNPPRIDFTAGVTGAEVPMTHPLWSATAAAILGQTGIEPFMNPLHNRQRHPQPGGSAGHSLRRPGSARRRPDAERPDRRMGGCAGPSARRRGNGRPHHGMVRRRWHGACRTLIALSTRPDLVRRLTANGNAPFPSTPAEFATLMRAQRATCEDLVRVSGVTPQ